jgi:hypothetical protein
MRIDKVLTELKAGAVIGLVGVFVSEVPRGEDYPLLLITPVSDEVMNTLGGEVQNIARFSVQIDIWSKSYSEALDLLNATRSAMSSSATYSSVLLTNRYEHDVANSLHRFSADFSIWN